MRAATRVRLAAQSSFAPTKVVQATRVVHKWGRGHDAKSVVSFFGSAGVPAKPPARALRSPTGGRREGAGGVQVPTGPLEPS
jgi:hypothetical protein